MRRAHGRHPNSTLPQRRKINAEKTKNIAHAITKSKAKKKKMLAISVLVYLLMTVVVGLLASRFVRNAEDFVLAGRQLPLVLAASAMFATWFGSETIMGASSEFVKHGLIGVIEDPFGAALCLLLVGAIFARPLYRMNILTFGDFYRIKYDTRIEVIAGFFLVISYFGWIAAQFVAMGILLNVVLGVSLPVGIAISAGVVLVYTAVGGMWSISITDFLQTIVILIGLILLLAELLPRAGGLSAVVAKTPPDFFRAWPQPTFADGIQYLAAWITIGLGSIPGQDLFQRVMSARSERVAVRAAYLSSFLYLSIGMLPLLIGLCATQLYPELLQGDEQMVLPMAVLQHSSLFVQVLFYGALLSAIMSTSSGAILAPATILAENLIKPMLPRRDALPSLLLLRASVVIIAVIAFIMASMRSNIYELVGESSALSLVSLFVPLTAGLFWKKATPTGALLAMFSGMATWLLFEFTALDGPPLIPGLIASFLGMLAGNFIHKPRSK